MNPQSAVATPPAPVASQPIATTADEGLKQLQTYQSSAQKPLDILTAREQSLGVPQAQQQVSGLRQAITNTTNLLNQVAPGVQGRTANSLVTSGQANKMIQNESAPITTSLQNQQQNYNQAQGDYRDLLGQAQGEANLAVQGQQNDISNLNSIYQNLFGGEKQTESVRQFNEQEALQKQQLTENTRQFDVGQANAKEQFEKNLALQTKQYDLSVQQQNELRRQFDIKQAQDAQQFQQTLAEQIRSNQASERISASKGSGSSNDGLGAALASIFAGGGGNTTTTAPPPDPSQTAAYTSVQKFLSQGAAAAKSDYAATLKSANYGNAMDKIKVQLYNQAGIK